MLAERHAQVGKLFVVRGELGAGKTVFAAGFASALGIDEAITSPTFGLANEYDLPGGAKLYHLDCYRFERPEEMRELGLQDYLYPENALTLLEWPERIEPLLPSARTEIEIGHITESQRSVIVAVYE